MQLNYSETERALEISVKILSVLLSILDLILFIHFIKDFDTRSCMLFWTGLFYTLFL